VRDVVNIARPLVRKRSTGSAIDLTGGPDAVTAAFGAQRYDVVLLIGVQHKLKRAMPADKLSDLIKHLGDRALTYFGWNGYLEDMTQMDQALTKAGLKRVHTSELRLEGRPAAIWKRR
jgi:ABC-type Na+ efflux pump permease subunit